MNSFKKKYLCDVKNIKKKYFNFLIKYIYINLIYEY